MQKDICLSVFRFLTKTDLTRTKKVCKLFKNLIETNALIKNAPEYSATIPEQRRRELVVKIYELLKKLYPNTYMTSDWNSYTTKIDAGEHMPWEGRFLDRHKPKLLQDKSFSLIEKLEEYFKIVKHEDFKVFFTKQLTEKRINDAAEDFMQPYIARKMFF